MEKKGISAVTNTAVMEEFRKKDLKRASSSCILGEIDA